MEKFEREKENYLLANALQPLYIHINIFGFAPAFVMLRSYLGECGEQHV